MASKKLIIVSTRLPVSVSKKDGKLSFSPSSGGLATGVSKVSQSRDSIWVGWPGISSNLLTKQDKLDIISELKKYKCYPVFLNDKQIDDYYSGYCNATLWPLFHYFTNMTKYKNVFWESYQQVNKLFYEQTKQFVTNDSLVWVHDYQLMLLPSLLRHEGPSTKIGFFLHTPFPSYEIFRLLPERAEVLKGLMGANLLGFHTYDYVRHFNSSVHRSLGYDVKLGIITTNEGTVKTDSFPIGIDYQKFAKSPNNTAVKKLISGFDIKKSKNKVILAVDRADYSKGIPERLDAFEKFLETYPQHLGKVELILLAVPSRGDVEEYQKLRDSIELKVSRINGQYSTSDWTPIKYRYQSLPFDELSALYAMADVMLVTPLRDGMNLVAKEYIATHHKTKGVLILSEMAGAASELQEAVQVNPNDYQMVAKAINAALIMPVKEQKQRMLAMQERISTYDINKWAEDFIGKLELSKAIESNGPKNLSLADTQQITAHYKAAKKRLLLLDYDGTLRSFVASPKASLAYPTPKVRRLIKKLTDDPANKVMVISGRPKSSLESFFTNKGLDLVAEHGGWLIDTGSWVKSNIVPKKWKKPVVELLNKYTERTPGSAVEIKDFSVAWHYRSVTPDLAYVRTQELVMELKNLLAGSEIDVFEGQKLIEIKPKSMHKGTVVTEVLSQGQYDFILSIGDDYTDEDMFNALPERAYSFKVGPGDSAAKYRLDGVKSVVNLLQQISKL